MDYDTYSANDAIGKVYIDLNPLLWPSAPTAIKKEGVDVSINVENKPSGNHKKCFIIMVNFKCPNEIQEELCVAGFRFLTP
jgi:hypothetical protein